MTRDALLALESHFAGQPRCGSEEFESQLRTALDLECAEVDFMPAVTGMRHMLPIAAAMVFALLSVRAPKSEVEGLSRAVEQSRQQASSVPTELETRWDD